MPKKEAPKKEAAAAEATTTISSSTMGLVLFAQLGKRKQRSSEMSLFVSSKSTIGRPGRSTTC